MGRARIFIRKTVSYAVDIDVASYDEAKNPDIDIDSLTPFHESCITDIVSLEGLGYSFCWNYLPSQGPQKRILILESNGIGVYITEEAWNIFIQAIKDAGIEIADMWNGVSSESGSVRYTGDLITTKQVAQIQKAIKDLQPAIRDKRRIEYWEHSIKAQKNKSA